MNKKLIFSFLIFISIAFILISPVSASCADGGYCSVNTFMKFTDDVDAVSKTVNLGDKIDLELIAIGYGIPLTYEKLISGSTTIVERHFPGIYSGFIYTSSETYNLDTNTLGVGTHILKFTASNGFFVSEPSTLTLIVEPITIPDTNPPVITVLGTNPIIMEVLSTYTDAGATAYDNEDGNLTSEIITTNPVNTNVVGNYTVTYYVEDSAGNSDTKTRTVRVINSTIPPTPDTTKPTIEITYPTDGTTYYSHRTYLRFNANDTNLDYCTYQLNSGPVQTDSCNNGINYIFGITSVGGTNTWKVIAYDEAGNSATDSVTFAVNILPPTDYDPVITVLGTNPIIMEVLSTYTDAGATAYDNEDGDLTSEIVITNPVNTNVVGNYIINYYVEDSAGNSDTKTRTVRVINSTMPPTSDTTKPTIFILYPTNTNYQTNVIKLNFTVNDTNLQSCWYKLNSNPTHLYVCSNGVNTITGITSVEGINTWTVFANDSFGNKANDTVVFTVNTTIIPPINNTLPIINLLGNNPITIEVLSPYIEAGATAYDAEDGNLTSQILISGSVNTNLVGTYNLVYSVKDSANNFVQAVRIVYVINSTIVVNDTTAPIITVIIPQDNQILKENENIIFKVSLNENAFTVYSLNNNINISMNENPSLIFTSGTLKPSLGNHQVIFCATDLAGNVACKKVNFVVKAESNGGGGSSNKKFYNSTLVDSPRINGFVNQTILEEQVLSRANHRESEGWIKFLWWILLIAIIIFSLIIYFLAKKRKH